MSRFSATKTINARLGGGAGRLPLSVGTLSAAIVRPAARLVGCLFLTASSGAEQDEGCPKAPPLEHPFPPLYDQAGYFDPRPSRRLPLRQSALSALDGDLLDNLIAANDCANTLIK